MSDCEYMNEDGTCGCERCSWIEEVVECEPDGCACYSPCDVEEEEDGDEWD